MNTFYGGQTDYIAQLNGMLAGSTLFTKVTIDDANFNLDIVSSNPRITFDSGDYLEYNRASNYGLFTGNLKVGGSNTTGTVGVGDITGSTFYCGMYRSSSAGAVSGGNYLGLGGYDGISFSAGNNALGSQTQMAVLTTTGLGLGTSTFGTSAAKVLAIANGTAPTTGPADTVQFYSSDDAAGHTIPSFFTEGTNVLATGQADSVSSVRVKMRVNGTVVTLLAI